MHAGHLFLFRVLVIALSLALVALTFIHHHQRGQITAFLVCEVGFALVLAIAAATFGYLW